jgi:threonine/homoserine/homoserine lactone efflux protein
MSWQSFPLANLWEACSPAVAPMINAISRAVVCSLMQHCNTLAAAAACRQCSNPTHEQQAPHPLTDINWLLFIIASTAIILTPGQDMVLVMSRSISHGTLAGMVTATGVSCGLLGHTLLAALGIGTLVQTSPLLFTAMKIVGAAYLLYLGISLLRDTNNGLLTSKSTQRSLTRLYLDGALSNIANPKIAIFFFAFLPQFVSPNAANPTWSIFLLGACFALLTMLLKGPIALLAGQLARMLSDNPLYLRNVFRVSGVTLIGLAVKLAFEER